MVDLAINQASDSHDPLGMVAPMMAIGLGPRLHNAGGDQ